MGLRYETILMMGQFVGHDSGILVISYHRLNKHTFYTHNGFF